MLYFFHSMLLPDVSLRGWIIRLNPARSGKKRICGCCVRVRAGVSIRVRVRISNRVRV